MQTNLRGEIHNLVMVIRYPDGEKIEHWINPVDDQIGALCFSDDLVDEFLVPSIVTKDSDQYKEWKAESLKWQDRPTYIAVRKPSSGMSTMVECHCCQFLHWKPVRAARINKLKSASINASNIDSNNTGLRGEIESIDIVIKYPNGHFLKEPVDVMNKLIIFDEELAERILKGKNDELLEEYKAGDNWKENHTYIGIPEISLTQGGSSGMCVCCYMLHRTQE